MASAGRGQTGLVPDVPTPSTPTPAPDAVVRYADHPDGIADVYVPASPARGTVLWLHGGFWRAQWDRAHARVAADDLRRRGYLVALPEYRRTGARGARSGGWPATFEDVRTVAARLPDLLGDHDVVARGFMVAGHSAGGHLALWLASEALPIQRVVALAPVGDLRDGYARRLGGGAVRALMGGSPARHTADYDAADPAVRLQHPPACEVVVLHGTHDKAVPIANSEWTRGLPHVELRPLPTGHFELIDPADPVWAEVLGALGGVS
jgi:acetyl esterase/lipase